MLKLDYLKKYMDSGTTDQPKKKKKRKLKSTKSNVKIIDDQISFADMKSLENDDDTEFDLMEEKPLLFASDGATILTKEFEDREKKKALSWAPIKSTDISPRRSSSRVNGSDVDISPPLRNRQRHDSDKSDISPPRQKRGRHDSSGSDMSPKRRDAQSNSDSDISPERKRENSPGSDVSPKRIRNKTHRKRDKEEPEVVSTGKKSGLQSGAELKKEIELNRRVEQKYIENMDASLSGKGAKTIVREDGKIVDIESEKIKIRREKEEKSKVAEQNAVWGRGIAQGKESERKLQDDLHEMQKPLARYKDDQDLDRMLKDQTRDGDPMLAYLSKKKNQQKDNKLSKPKYNGPTPPSNRFSIWPGYRYDGVDRSNGFEKKRFLAINETKSFNEAKYKWSVEDM